MRSEIPPSLLGLRAAPESAVFAAEATRFKARYAQKHAEKALHAAKRLTRPAFVALVTAGCATLPDEHASVTPNSIPDSPTPAPTLFVETPTQTITLTRTPEPTLLPLETPVETTRRATQHPPAEASTTPTVPSIELDSRESEPIYTAVDIMKMAKDTLWDPPSLKVKQELVQQASVLGVSHVQLSMHFDNPSNIPANTVETQRREWIQAIREVGLNVSHRYMFANFEGDYDQPKRTDLNYIEMMRDWMLANGDLIQDGDIWMPFPEVQNGGVNGINCDPKTQTCMFESIPAFNAFVRELVTTSRQTLGELGKNNQIYCCGFDGTVVSWNNNSDREGQTTLEPETLAVLKENGAVAIDHYPTRAHYATGRPRTYGEDLAQFETTIPGVPMVLTEFGIPDVNDPATIPHAFADFRDRMVNGQLIGVAKWPFNWSGPNDSPEGLLDANNQPNRLFESLREGFASLPPTIQERPHSSWKRRRRKVLPKRRKVRAIFQAA